MQAFLEGVAWSPMQPCASKSYRDWETLSFHSLAKTLWRFATSTPIKLPIRIESNYAVQLPNLCRTSCMMADPCVGVCANSRDGAWRNHSNCPGNPLPVENVQRFDTAERTLFCVLLVLC